VRVIKVSDRRADGTWTSPHVVARRSRVNGEWGFASASGPRGTVVVVWNKFVDGHDTLLERHREGGRWSAVRELGDNTAGGGWTAVVDRRGSITVAWANGRSGGSVNVIARGAGGHWGQPQQMAVDADSPHLAVNQRGDVVLAWAARHGVGVAIHRRGSRAWRTTPLLRSPFQYPESLQVAIDETGVPSSCGAEPSTTTVLSVTWPGPGRAATACGRHPATSVAGDPLAWTPWTWR
jgi:hypothetical protein